MKLFIINKKEFTEFFDDPERLQNTSREPLTSSQIHIKAFNELKFSITSTNSIPLILTPEYDYGDGCCVFIFKNKKEDVYFYEYSGTAS